MRRAVLFCHRHAWWVIGAWLVLLATLTAANTVAGPDYRDSLNLPASDSQLAQNLLTQVKGAGQGSDQELVVIGVSSGGVAAPSVRDRVGPMLGRLAALPHVSSVVSPYVAPGGGRISRDGREAIATVALDVQAVDLSPAQARTFVATARSGEAPGLTVAVSGSLAERASPPTLGGAYIGLIAAAAVLLITFGSVFAMVLPLLAAAASVGSGVAIVGLISHTMTVAQDSPEVAALVGLGVGVDYSLFLVTRYRQGLMAGHDRERALGEAAVTSGRSVLFAGLTVCVALLGMFTVGITFLYGLALGSSITVLLTMVAALTLLPALLRLFGDRVLSRRERRRLAAGELLHEREGRLWGRWARFVGRRAALPVIAALAAIGVLAVPFFSMRLGIPDAGTDPAGSTTRQAYDMISDGFGPGFTGPLFVTGRADTASERRALTAIAAGAARLPDVVGVSPPAVDPAADGGRIAVLTVYPGSSPQDTTTTGLVHALRGYVDSVTTPATRGTPARFYVGGATAIGVDFSKAVTDRLPLFLGTVIAISLLLLLVVFRSVVIPLTAAVMNVLSAATAFGVITAVFQWGWLASAIGVDRAGPIEPYIPVLLFAGLFGLSMDYEVFLVTRIQEEWRSRRDNREAVVHGLTVTGRTITAAAAIMVLVFAAFVLGGARVIKEAGLGLAVAVLLDAVIVRSVLVPAVMTLLGRANWWLPRGLDRTLPKVRVEAEDAPEPEPAEAASPPGGA